MPSQDSMTISPERHIALCTARPVFCVCWTGFSSGQPHIQPFRASDGDGNGWNEFPVSNVGEDIYFGWIRPCIPICSHLYEFAAFEKTQFKWQSTACSRIVWALPNRVRTTVFIGNKWPTLEPSAWDLCRWSEDQRLGWTVMEAIDIPREIYSVFAAQKVPTQSQLATNTMFTVDCVTWNTPEINNVVLAIDIHTVHIDHRNKHGCASGIIWIYEDAMSMCPIQQTGPEVRGKSQTMKALMIGGRKGPACPGAREQTLRTEIWICLEIPLQPRLGWAWNVACGSTYSNKISK